MDISLDILTRRFLDGDCKIVLLVNMRHYRVQCFAKDYM